jgi:hypothetical protein
MQVILRALRDGARWLAVLTLVLGNGALTTAFSCGARSLAYQGTDKQQALSQRCPAELGVRNGHAMTYDSNRRKVVLYGGADAVQVCSDTWEWDGSCWNRVSVTGPGPRTFAALAYDSVRKRVVLFGGNRVLFGKTEEDNRLLGDTWEWDGQQWLEIKAPGPLPRAETAIVFDRKRGRVLLFGGYNRSGSKLNRLGDTWEWDGVSWNEVKVLGPSPRSGAARTWDDGRGKVVLFGGQNSSSETWEWDGKRWVENRAAITEGRFNAVMAYARSRRRVIRFGGVYRGQRVGDTWEYDGRRWQRIEVAGPAARNHAAMVYDEARQRIVLFGGHDGDSVFGDTWEWDGRQWAQVNFVEARRRVENGH